MTELMLIVMIVLLLAGFPMKMPLISAAVLGPVDNHRASMIVAQRYQFAA